MTSQPDTHKSALTTYKRLLGYAWPYRWVFLAGVVGMFLGATAEAGFAALLKPLMDEAFVQQDASTIRYIPFAIIGVVVLRGFSGFVDSYCIHWVGRKVIFDLRNLLFERMIHLPSKYYDKNPTSELVSKLIFDIEQIAQASTNAVRIFFHDLFLVVALLSWMTYLSWKLTLVFVAIAPLIAFLVRILSKRFRFTSGRIQDTMSDITQVAGEAFQGNQVIKAFNGFKRELRRFDKVNRSNRRFWMRKAIISSISVPIVMFVAGLAISLIIYFALGGNSGKIVTPGTFVSYLGAVMLMQSPIKRLAKVNEIIQTGVAAAESVFKILDLKEEPKGGDFRPDSIAGKITFKDVTFAYPGEVDDVLLNLNLTVEAGQTIALVGASGSGKSTIASLLLGFYDDLNGQILLDDIPIGDYSRTTLRDSIALVTQNNFLFDGTIEENIGYNGDEAIDSDEVIAAGMTAQVSAFADTFKSGYQTPVGEQGTRLSGGQKQRIVIARALYKNAPVLVLDEATSALDNESEQLVRQAIDAMAGKRTIIVIAHRLSTVVNADCIYVMDKGRIIESGTHSELSSTDSAYYRLLTRQ